MKFVPKKSGSVLELVNKETQPLVSLRESLKVKIYKK